MLRGLLQGCLPDAWHAYIALSGPLFHTAKLQSPET
jgi:hypothetical protein